MNSHSNEAQKSHSWWNRPLWGNHSLVEKVILYLKSLKKSEIPEATVDLYQSSYVKLKNISAILKTIDNIKFTNKEFIDFLKLNRQFEQETGPFAELKNSIELLRVALETKESFLKIEATETSYRSFSQQEFYQNIYDLLEKDLPVEEFREKAQRELNNVIPKIKSDRGQAAIQSYVNQLDIVSEDKLGLKLLYFFKQYDMSSFSILRSVADIADSFYEKDIDSLREFRVVVQVHADIFLKLGKIIRVPKTKNVPETYAVILHYIALRNRHQESFSQFQQLLNLLRQWQKVYNSLITILQEYPSEEYKQPLIFKEPIPAIDIYNKYQSHV